ncbi:glycosyltransferase [Nonomuraea endophytica]|uniref:Glycosyltransferase involved in cell wall biosynthesis n=1 Tax=Nonomuraea endophytica TaxID=714136 RepID=A0A7W8EJZ6_9ACTN|nr:glycosyltransferase [Nonomuraea endophytica]MBB5082088.1 glycosyltransferase involved in cell wall biosynthesis [Nonomuraea endophytica]
MTISVLHVSQPVEAGVAAYVSAAAADQARRGWRVTVAAPSRGTLPDRLAEQKISHVAWESARSPVRSCKDETVALRRIVDELEPDIIHLHSAKAGLVGRLAVRGRRPTLFQPHGWSWLACRGATARTAIAWERTAARWAAAIVCVGEGEAEAGAARGVAARLVVVRNGVDLDHFTPAGIEGQLQARAELGIPSHARLAVCVGRLTRQKGQDLLLRAWPRVLRSCPDAQLALVGDGELKAQLEAEALPGVRFAGPSADVRPWYAASDLVVMPSRWEGLPLTALEAMASARPVVGFDIPGLREVIGEETGALVTAGDLRGLAHALSSRLSSHDGTAWREGQVAALLSKEFDARVTMEVLAGVTAGVLGRG